MSRRAPADSEVAVPKRVAVLAPHVEAGVFGSYEVHLAATVARIEPSVSDEALLALALASRAPRFGHVFVDLDTVAGLTLGDDVREVDVPTPPWPEAGAWTESLQASAIVARPDDAASAPIRPLVLDGRRVYLQRYFVDEVSVARDLVARASDGFGDREARRELSARVDAVVEAVFGSDERPGDERQRTAARRALLERVSIIAGGPGTGKTSTVARLVAAAHLTEEFGSRGPLIALAAPTGKAASRLADAVADEACRLAVAGTIDAGLAETIGAIGATTLHRLLGRHGRTRSRRVFDDPVPHDLVIVDETSMVSLPLVAELLGALRPRAHLVLVGDPSQLASIEAGNVMGDLTGPVDAGPRSGGAVLEGRITVLDRLHRFAAGSPIAALAEAVRTADGDQVVALLTGGHDELDWVPADDPGRIDVLRGLVVDAGAQLATAALAGDTGAALDGASRLKVLAATRRGPYGLSWWNERIEADVAAAVPALNRSRRFYAGRPVIVTENDRAAGVANGDTGVAVVNAGGTTSVAMTSGEGVRLVAPSRLHRVETWWAMTIHKSQGSEFDHAVVSLPEAGSPILTRELLYTAVTRAKSRLTVLAGEESIRAAVARPAARASGLGDRLWP